MNGPKSLGRFLALGGVLFVTAALVTLMAVHSDGLFELGDGTELSGTADIVGSDLQDGCDWGDLFDADPTDAEIAAAVEACGGIDAAFVADQLSVGNLKDDTVFAGSAKNDAPVTTWTWTTGGSPAKDDLTNVYAYATLDEAGELVLFAGVERLAPKGDSHIDFELNQFPIEPGEDPPCDDSPCAFSGEKTVGDLLLVMDFKKGGDFGFVEIRRWDGADYVVAETIGGEGCNAADTVCAFNNGSTIDAGAWPTYDPKGEPTTTLDANAFTEIGVNVSQLFGESPCFVSLTAKSRSSSSYNSSLKDFAQTSFNVCSFDITKGGSTDNPDPDRSKRTDEFIFTYRIENTGAGTLYLQNVTDSFLGNITDEARNATAGFAAATDGGPEGLIQSVCDPLAPGTFCSFDIVSSVPEDADDPFETSVEATYGTQPGFGDSDAPVEVAFNASPFGESSVAGVDGGEENSLTVRDTDDFPLNLFQPSVDVEKTGDAISTPGNLALYTITITNTSSDDSPDLANGVVIDTLLGDLLDPANPFVTSSTCAEILPVGETCVIEAAREVLPDDPDPLPNTVEATYNPAGGYPNIITDSADHSVDLVYPSMTLTVEASPSSALPGDVVTYTYTIENTGDIALERIVVVDTLLGDLSDLFPDRIEPGDPPVVVTVTRTVLPTDPDPLVNEATAEYQVDGLPNTVVRIATFAVDVIVPCALSPGFWGGGSGVSKWDDILSDPIAQTAGFDTNTVFPWLDPSLAGTTYLGILNLPAQGDVTRQLSFKYVAARLNEAAFGVPSWTADLLDNIDLYFMQHPVGSDPQGADADTGAALFAEVNRYFAEIGEGSCPPTSEF